MAGEAVIYRVARKFREALLRRDRAATKEMVRAYGEAWRRIRQRLDVILGEYQRALQDSNRNLKSTWVYEFNRLAGLRSQVEAEITRLNGQVAEHINNQQQQAVDEAERAATDAIRAASMRAPVSVGVDWHRLPKMAMMDLVGRLQDGSPLKTLLDELGPQASKGIGDALISGLALGKNPREIAREIRQEFAVPLARSMLISRTEVLRSYREATLRSYQENEQVVEGWYWQAAHQDRTCPACLAMDGTFHKLSEHMNTHPGCRCTQVPAVKSWAEMGFKGVPDDRKPPQTGEEWFREQSGETQRKILGNAAYEAYRAGQVELSDFVKVRRSQEWGKTLQTKSLKEAVGAEEARAWQKEAVENKRKTVGYTWFKGELASVEQAQAIGEGPNGWEKHEKIFRRDYLARYGANGEVERTLGLWSSPEPSFNARLRGSPETVVEIAKAWGKAYNQDAVAVLLPDPAGTGGKLIWEFGRELTTQELDAILGGIRTVNGVAAEQVAKEFGLDYFQAGLTVRGHHRLEFWADDDRSAGAGKRLIRLAIESSGIKGATAWWRGGFRFHLLLKGDDY